MTEYICEQCGVEIAESEVDFVGDGTYCPICAHEAWAEYYEESDRD